MRFAPRYGAPLPLRRRGLPMRAQLVVGAALSALGFVAACSSSSSSSNPYPGVTEFCTAVAQAECQESANCGGSKSDCETYRQAQCTGGTIVLPLADSDTLSRTYTSANAQNCINALNSTFNSGNV